MPAVTRGGASLDAALGRRALQELCQLEREVVEGALVRRADGLEHAREASRRLGDIGTPEGILDRSAEELGAGSEFDRVLIGRVEGDALVAHALWTGDDGADATLERLAAAPVQLRYPLVEHDVAQRQLAAIVDVEQAGGRSPAELADVLGWRSYVVSALTLRGTTVGLLHADATASARRVDETDREVVALYADGLAGAFERAALRAKLDRHREELRDAAAWMSEHVRASPRPDVGQRQVTAAPGLVSLTAREREVLALLVDGATNRGIAKTLVIGEGTVKYHVKNILRKLNATSRADAVARYLGGSPPEAR